MSSPKYLFIALLVYESDVGEVRKIHSGDIGDAVGKDLSLGDDSSSRTLVADEDILIEETSRHSGGLIRTSLDSHHEDVAIGECTEVIGGDSEGVLAFVVAGTDAGRGGKLLGGGNDVVGAVLADDEVFCGLDSTADGLQHDGCVGCKDCAHDLEGFEDDSLSTHLGHINRSADRDSVTDRLGVQRATRRIELVDVKPNRELAGRI